MLVKSISVTTTKPRKVRRFAASSELLTFVILYSTLFEDGMNAAEVSLKALFGHRCEEGAKIDLAAEYFTETLYEFGILLRLEDLETVFSLRDTLLDNLGLLERWHHLWLRCFPTVTIGRRSYHLLLWRHHYGCLCELCDGLCFDLLFMR